MYKYSKKYRLGVVSSTVNEYICIKQNKPMKLLQKYLKDNAELEHHSESSNSTYWKMYGKKWRVSSHVNVNPAMNQILFQENSNRTVLILNGNVNIFNTFKELEESLEALRVVSLLLKKTTTPIVEQEIKTGVVSDEVVNNDIKEVISNFIKRTNYKCLKPSSIETAMLRYLNVEL